MMKLTLQPFFKRTVACYIFAALFVGTSVFSQENAEEKLLLLKAGELVYSNPDETIKIANHLQRKDTSEKNAVEIDILLSNSYKVKGDYQKAVSYIFDASSKSGEISDSLAVEIAFIKADLSRKLHLYSQMEAYLNEVKLSISELEHNYALAVGNKIDIERIYADVERKQYEKALKALNIVERNDKTLSGPYNNRLDIEYLKAVVYKGLHKTALSRESFNSVFADYEKQNIPSTLLEAKVLLGLGQLYYDEKNYDKAISTLLLSLQKAEKLNNSPLKEAINYQLSENYFAKGNKAEHQKYFSVFLKLNDDNLNMETETVNSMYNLISEEQELNYAQDKSTLLFFAYIILACMVLIVASGLLLYRINKAKRRQLKEIIGYLEVTNKLLVKSDSDKKEPNKKITISTETEHVILAKLKKFEASTKYTSNDMSLATLAAQLDVNTKYLSEIINKHYHDNFNTYINKLRINYIIEKLKNEPEYLNYKISYLAEECGFSSHSSFATVFKSITGIAPTIFIDLIGKEVTLKKA
ncbi:helix-turn-helix domain-containing protein [Flavobacterium hauense]